MLNWTVLGIRHYAKFIRKLLTFNCTLFLSTETYDCDLATYFYSESTQQKRLRSESNCCLPAQLHLRNG